MKNRFSTLFSLLAALFFFATTGCGTNEGTEGADAEPAAAESENPDRGTATATIAGVEVSIEYGRPDLNGRDVLAMAEAGLVWRMGKNQATVMTTSGDLTIGGSVVKAGRHTLWLKKTEDGWELLVNEQAEDGMWGSPSPTEGYVATATMAVSELEESHETFTVEVSAGDDNTGTITAMWANTSMSAAVSGAGS